MTDIKVVLLEDNIDSYFKDIFRFCVIAEQESKQKQLKKNMGAINWKDNSCSLLHKLYIQKSCSNDNGLLTLTYNKEILVAVSTIERSDFDPYNVAILMRRDYVLKSYRNHKITAFALPFQFSWASQRNIKIGLMTLNEYDDRILKWFKRKISRGQNPIYWTMPFFDISRILIYPEKVRIANTIQYMIIHYIDKNYDWNIPKEIKL